MKKSSRSWVLPSLKPFKCTNPECTKSFLNQNGLKYHRSYGTCVKRTTSTELSSDRPYFCYEDACAKAYKNMNGLRYHYLHSGDHGEKGMNMLNDGTHPPFLDRSSSSSSSSAAVRRSSVSRNGHTTYGGSSQETSTASSGHTTPSAVTEEPEQQAYEQTYVPSQPMPIQGAAEMMSPSLVSQSLLEAVNLFSDQPAPQYGNTNHYQNGTFDSRMAAYQQAQQYGAASVPGEWSGNQAGSYYDPSTGILLPHTNAKYYSVSQPQNFNAAFAPPPITFGARTHRFHPYSTSGARSYLPPVMQSPQKPTYMSPRARRLSL